MTRVVSSKEKIKVLCRGLAAGLLISSSLMAGQAAGGASASVGDLPSDMTKQKGHGIDLSEDGISKVHLGLDAAMGFNSNPYSLSVNALNPIKDSAQYNALVSQAPKANPDLIFKLRPNIALDVPGKMIGLNLNLKADLGILPDVTNSGRNWTFLVFNGHSDGGITVNKEGALSFFVNDGVTVTRTPAELFVSDLTNVTNDLAMGINIRPGKNTDIRLDGTYSFQYWPSDVDSVFKNVNPAGLALNNESLYGHLNVKWNFSSTGNVYVDAKGGRYRLTQLLGTNSYPLWALVGINGQLSNRLTGDINVGYANPFTQLSSNNQLLSGNLIGVIGNASLTWVFTPDSFLSLGYMRNVIPVPAFFNVTTNSGYVSYAQMFNRKNKLTLSPTVNHMYFGLPLGANNTSLSAGQNRQDIGFELKAEYTYFVREWFGLGFYNSTSLRWTNSDVATITGLGGQLSAGQGYNMLFTKNETLFVVNFNY